MAKQPRITVVGSINEDITTHSHRLPVPGETIGGATLARYAGGKGANQAVALARLGAEVVLFGAVGRDEAGRSTLQRLRAAGVNVDAVSRSSLPTGTALVLVDDAGENSIVVAPGANDDVTPPGTTSGVLLAQLELPLAVVWEAARSHRGFFALNAAPAIPLPSEIIERCDLVIVNDSEHAAMPELANARLLAVTHGGAGASLLRSGVVTATAESPAVNVVTSVGAGDAFCAALLLALTLGWDDHRALQAACRVGADAVTSALAQPPLRPLEAYDDVDPTFARMMIGNRPPHADESTADAALL